MPSETRYDLAYIVAELMGSDLSEKPYESAADYEEGARRWCIAMGLEHAMRVDRAEPLLLSFADGSAIVQTPFGDVLSVPPSTRGVRKAEEKSAPERCPDTIDMWE